MANPVALRTISLDTTFGTVRFPGEQEGNILAYSGALKSWIGIPATAYLQQQQQTASIAPWSVVTSGSTSTIQPTTNGYSYVIGSAPSQAPILRVESTAFKINDANDPTNPNKGILIKNNTSSYSSLQSWILPLNSGSSGQFLKNQGSGGGYTDNLIWDWAPTVTIQGVGNITAALDTQNSTNTNKIWNISTTSPNGTVVSVSAGTGLTTGLNNGPITSTGTISMDASFGPTEGLTYPFMPPLNGPKHVVTGINMPDGTGRVSAFAYLTNDNFSILATDSSGNAKWTIPAINNINKSVVLKDTTNTALFDVEGNVFTQNPDTLNSTVSKYNPSNVVVTGFDTYSSGRVDMSSVKVLRPPVGGSGKVVGIDGSGNVNWLDPAAGPTPITILAGSGIGVSGTSAYTISNTAQTTLVDGLSTQAILVSDNGVTKTWKIDYNPIKISQFLSTPTVLATLDNSTPGIEKYSFETVPLTSTPGNTLPFTLASNAGVISGLTVDNYGRVSQVYSTIGTGGNKTKQFLSTDNSNQLVWKQPLLSELSGVSITSPTSGNTLKFDGTNWVNGSGFITGVQALNGGYPSGLTAPNERNTSRNDDQPIFVNHAPLAGLELLIFSYRNFRSKFCITQKLMGHNVDTLNPGGQTKAYRWPTRYSGDGTVGFWKLGQTTAGVGNATDGWQYTLDQTVNGNRTSLSNGYAWDSKNLKTSFGSWDLTGIDGSGVYTTADGYPIRASGFTVDAEVTFCQNGAQPIAARLVLAGYEGPAGSSPDSSEWNSGYLTNPNAWKADLYSSNVQANVMNANTTGFGMPLQFVPGSWEKTNGDGDMRTCRIHEDYSAWNTRDQYLMCWAVYLECVNINTGATGNYATVPGTANHGALSTGVALGKDAYMWRYQKNGPVGGAITDYFVDARPNPFNGYNVQTVETQVQDVIFPVVTLKVTFWA